MQLDLWDKLITHAKGQQWPNPALYVVATPIGNLLDLSPRAYYALSNCDIIAAEDTRNSQTLLNFWGIRTAFMPAHRHNEQAAAQDIIKKLELGQNVALVSDAGAPAVSDPGSRIVNAVRNAGFKVVPIPGASSVITALMVSGATSDENPSFCFAGFVPPKQVARRKWLQTWSNMAMAVIMFETPHRISDCLQDLLHVCGSNRKISIARELTKKFEDVYTDSLDNAIAWLQEKNSRKQGEFVLVLHEDSCLDTEIDNGQASINTRDLMLALLQGLSVRDAAKQYAALTGVSRDTAYNLALSLKD